VIAARSARAAARTALVALLLAGCASLPPEKPITSIGDIVGEWRGTIQFGAGPFQFVNVSIRPDATMYYLEGPEGRFLLLKANFGVFDAQVSPVK
jgi:hypothetical protein